MPTTYDYDLAVIGGGSGGMAAAKEAARLGAKVALFDFVKPTSHGTKWGLGGTCVNVGCVPKKIMHYSGLLGAGLHDAAYLGWDVPAKATHNWATLVDAVQSHVKKLNFSYRVGLRSNKVQYINALARFEDAHTLAYEVKGGPTQTLSAEHILIATGGRPAIPDDIPGVREHAITSDDLFSLERAPGKTLVVGASYIALECAGFLNELHYPVSVAVRSILLRGFDRQVAAKIHDIMFAQGVDFRFGFLPSAIAKDDAGRLHVTFANAETGETYGEDFDTVLYATGRTADTRGLQLAKAGVDVLPNGKFATVAETTNVPHIHAVGDVLQGKPELTPVAIRAGEHLVRRLFRAGYTKTMDYDLVPTTVFTPVEYGTIGLSEEDAIARYGKDDIVVYPWEFQTLEWGAVHRKKAAQAQEGDYDTDFPANCLSKLVCLKSANEKVVGFHFVGPNAGEVTQGFAVAVAMGATKAHFDDVVGIHPTDAESFMALTVTKESGASWVATGGCGGGVCG